MTQPMGSRVETFDTVRYVRVYADATGVSRFEDGDFTLAAMNFAPLGAAVPFSAPLPASASWC